MLDAMEQLMTGNDTFEDQAFLDELLACMDMVNPVLKTASVSTPPPMDGEWEL